MKFWAIHDTIISKLLSIKGKNVKYEVINYFFYYLFFICVFMFVFYTNFTIIIEYGKQI